MFPELFRPFYGIITAKQDEQLFWKSYGPNGDLPTIHTQYRIASVTKTFIGAAFSILTEQGFDLNTPINLLLPEFTHPQANEITVHHLLCHRSGLGSFITNNNTDPFHEKERSLQWLIARTSELSLQFTPGTNSTYSPPGYILLGAILERYTKQSCAEWLGKNLFMPFHLKNTIFYPQGTIDENRTKYPSLPQTYQWIDEKIIPLETLRNFSTSQASGAIISTAQDLLNWFETLLIHQTVVSQTVLSKMLQDYGQGYGYGICIGSSGKHPVYYHFGSTSGITSLLLTCPNLKSSLCILSHIQDYPMAKLAKEIWPHIGFYQLQPAKAGGLQ